MPIKDLSDVVRLPRLGKIHLGTKHPEKGYPMKADHFIFPKDHSDYPKLVELFGEASKELRILIPVEDEETWASQYYKAYSQTRGLLCKGDGEVAMRVVDIKTGELPNTKTGTVTMKEMPCAGQDCPEYKAKKCHEVMNFRFIIPEIPGLGVWQIDTGSKNSIMNINSCAYLIKRAFGRIAMIPLKLTFEPIEVSNPETGKKQTVYVLNLRTDVTIAQLASVAKEQVKMLTVRDLESAWEMEVEKDIDDLWGEKPKADVSTGEITEGKAEKPKTKPEPIRKAPQATPVDEAEVARDIATLWPSEDKPEPAQESVQQQSEPPKQKTGSKTPETSIGEVDIDVTLRIIKWSETTAKSWVISQFRLYKDLSQKEKLAKSLGEVLEDCSPEQKAQFLNHITAMRESAGQL